MGPESGNLKVGQGFQGPQIRPRYAWCHAQGGWKLTWEGNIIASVEGDGRYWVRWRGIDHRGHIRSVRLARLFIDRWLAARRPLPPLKNADLPPAALVSLERFLRDYDEFGF